MIRKLSILCTIIVLFVTIGANAFNSYNDVPGGFRKMLVADGIPSSEVYELYQDTKGYLWLATDAGICRYNGVTFTNYTSLNGLTDNTVFHIKEDSRGRIWVQTFTGAVCYFADNRFWPIPANPALEAMYSHGQKTTYTFFIDRNDCVVIGGLGVGGCYRISPIDGYKQLRQVSSPFAATGTREIWTDNFGQLYCSGEANYSSNSSFKILHNSHVVEVPIVTSTSFAINIRTAITKRNVVYFSNKSTLYSVDTAGQLFTREFPGIIIGICEDISGDLWVNLLGEGTVRFPNGDLSAPGFSYLKGYSVSNVCQDTEKGFWFSTVGNGVLFLAGLEFGYLTPSEGLPPFNITAFSALGNGQVLIGQAFSHLTLLKTTTFHKSKLVSGTLGTVNEIATDIALTFQGKLLANADKTYMVDSSMKAISTTVPVRHIKGFAIHPSGDTLFGFSHSGFVWVDKEFHEVKSSMAPVRIICACYMDNVLWLGGLNGLWRMNDTVPEYMGSAAAGLNTRIDDMVADRQGRLWIATRGDGVFVLDHDTVHHFSLSSGLSSNTCRSIALDEKGNVWVATNHGISILSDYNTFNGRVKISQYNTSDGLLSDEVNFIEVKEGVVWMAGPDGLCWVPNNKLLNNLTPPPVYITSIFSGKDTLHNVDSVVIDYNDNRLRILFEGLSMRNSSKLSYRYKLVGAGNDWINTFSNEISLTNLEPGDYTFVLYALNSNSILSKEPALLHLHVTRPFTKTIWFYLLIISVFLTVVVLIVRLRLNNVRQKASRRSSEERRMAELRLSALRAQMNPHFIFNAINSIQHYILNKDSDKAYSYLAKFSKLIRLVLDQSQSNTITLKQELELLLLYIELEQLRFDQPINIGWFVSPTIDQSSIRIPGMLIQPFIENAIWHGLLPMKTRVATLKISFVDKDDNLTIVIEDNGIGREAAQHNRKESSRRSYGMLITNERLKLLDRSEFNVHRITVTDKKNELGEPLGTRVEIMLSMSNLHNEL